MSNWTPWESFDGSLSSIALVKYFDGRVELFGVNSDDVIFHRVQNSPQTDSWGDWEVIPGSLENIAATADEAGRLQMYYTVKTPSEPAFVDFRALDRAVSVVGSPPPTPTPTSPSQPPPLQVHTYTVENCDDHPATRSSCGS